MTRQLHTFVLCMSLLLPCRFGQAQHIHDTEEIVVTARPAGSQNVGHISQSVGVLSGDELREKMAAGIGETLAQELGVSASDFGQGAGRPIIRGLGGGRVRVLENGIGSLDLSTISVDHAVTIDPMHSEQIEILRGPATLLYGSGAFGGLVNIVNDRLPLEPPDAFESQLEARFNSAFNETTLAFRADGGIDTLGLHFDALRRDTGDYSAASGEVDNSEIETDDLNFGIARTGARAFFGAAYGRFASVYEIPIDPAAPEEQIFIDQSQNRLDLAGGLREPLPGIRRVQARGGYVDYEHTEFEAPREPGTHFDNDEWEGRLEIQHAPIGVWTGTVGLQYLNRSFSAEGEEAFLPGTQMWSLGFFALEDTDWRNWHLEFGARLELQSAEPASASGLPAADHEVYSLGAGALWNFSSDYSLGLALTRSQRAPAIEEMFAGGPHLATGSFEEGDARLQEESSNNLDLSLRRSEGIWTWTVNLFLNYIEDFIFLQKLDENGDGVPDRVDTERQPGGDLLLVSHRHSDAPFWGLEAETRLELLNDHRGRLDLRFWGDRVRGELQGGEDLPRISPPRLGASLEYNRGAWHGDAGIMNVFRQDHSGALETETGGYALLNAGLSYELQAGPSAFTIYLRATNLLDEEARRHTSFLKDRAPLPGRALTAGFSVAF